MKRQRGQSMVEFALMAPIVFMMIFGMIYGGIMFMQYMHFSNFVRTAARQIAVSGNTTSRQAIIDDYKQNVVKIYNDYNMPDMYTPTVKFNDDDIISDDDVDVVVTVTFVRKASLPVILDRLDFPPQTIKALQYHMKLEGTTNTNSTG